MNTDPNISSILVIILKKVYAFERCHCDCLLLNRKEYDGKCRKALAVDKAELE